MSAAYTPGPWAVYRPHANSLPHIRSVADGTYVMDAPPRNERLHAHVRQDADARLIAAAPDLLNACEQAVLWLEGWASADPYIGSLRAAIAKATEAE